MRIQWTDKCGPRVANAILWSSKKELVLHGPKTICLFRQAQRLIIKDRKSVHAERSDILPKGPGRHSPARLKKFYVTGPVGVVKGRPRPARARRAAGVSGERARAGRPRSQRGRLAPPPLRPLRARRPFPGWAGPRGPTLQGARDLGGRRADPEAPRWGIRRNQL